MSMGFSGEQTLLENDHESRRCSIFCFTAGCHSTRKCKDIRKTTSEYDTVYLNASKYIKNGKVIVYMTYELYSYMFTYIYDILNMDIFDSDHFSLKRQFVSVSAIAVLFRSIVVFPHQLHQLSIHINCCYFNKILPKSLDYCWCDNGLS